MISLHVLVSEPLISCIYTGIPDDDQDLPAHHEGKSYATEFTDEQHYEFFLNPDLPAHHEGKSYATESTDEENDSDDDQHYEFFFDADYPDQHLHHPHHSTGRTEHAQDPPHSRTVVIPQSQRGGGIGEVWGKVTCPQCARSYLPQGDPVCDDVGVQYCSQPCRRAQCPEEQVCLHSLVHLFDKLPTYNV
jgi:hypothetical protein